MMITEVEHLGLRFGQWERQAGVNVQALAREINSHHFGRIPCQHCPGVREGHMLWSFGITIAAILHPVQFSWGNLRRLLGSSQGLLKSSLSGSCKKWVGTCCLRLSTTNGSSCLHPPVRSLLWNFNFHWTKRLIWVGCALRHDETSSPISQFTCWWMQRHHSKRPYATEKYWSRP